MDPNALLTEIMRRADFVFAGWNVLMVAGLGLLAAVGLSPALRADRPTGRALAAGFAFFALTHRLGMLHVTKQWASLEAALQFKLANEAVLREHLGFAMMAPHAAWIVPFHLAFDAFVLLALWRVGRAPRG